MLLLGPLWLKKDLLDVLNYLHKTFHSTNHDSITTKIRQISRFYYKDFFEMHYLQTLTIVKSTSDKN